MSAPVAEGATGAEVVRRPPAHAAGVGDLARALGTDPVTGLPEAEAEARLRREGANRLPTPSRPPYLVLAARQFADPLVLLLVAAAAVSAGIGERIEAAAIGAIVLLNGLLGFVQEAAAERAMLALRRSFTTTAHVVRGGGEREISAEELVAGDLVVLREGARVPADVRIVGTEHLEVDESALTGESLPVEKSAEPVAAGTPLAERGSMAYTGTSVTRGRARGLVVAVGPATELGSIVRLAEGAKPPATPLQRRLGRLARAMVVLGIGVTLALGAGLLARGESLHEAFLVAVAVAVAAVPEGLAATVTVALALGAREMARRGAIVRRLSAIETLGETTTICTDKTGTLTENRLRVAGLHPVEGVLDRELVAAGVLASTAELSGEGQEMRVLGDPVEGALLLAAIEHGLSRADLLESRRHVHEVPFDPELKRMSIVYEEDGGLVVYVKGAPEEILARARTTDAERAQLEDAASAWAEEGFRVLAVAARPVEDGRLHRDVDLGARPLGLVALHDPLRATAPDAIAAARRAGIEVRMLTGDHPRTARTIGHALGLSDDVVHARVTPGQKLSLVEELQRQGEVVAVTGDGVNDAPALRRADVGVAMGHSGTEAAREASAVVLTDDDFATIVAAVAEGRRIGDNVRKVVAFLLSANLGEVALFAVAILAGLPAPMTVVQVLTINLVTDGFPALALARDRASTETMVLGPRRGATLLGRGVAGGLLLAGFAVGAVALGAYLAGRALDPAAAQTMAFATIALAELAFVFACRSVREAAWRIPWNPHLVLGVVVSAVVVGAAVYLPALHEPLATVPLSAAQLAIVVALAAVPFAAVEVAKMLLRRPRGRRLEI